MRFHHLADAVVVMDEVQALPPVLWEPLRLVFGELVRLGATRLLAMSATQPGFLPEAAELAGDPAAFFARMTRYTLRLRLECVLFTGFVAECRARLRAEWSAGRVMLVMNTRRSAKRLRRELAPVAAELGLDLLFISADVTPADRLEAIHTIKLNRPCLVVATQCVEAGVDIDLDLVVRDFGPLDSVVQVAGRCNRSGRLPRGVVEVVNLADDERPNGRRFCEYVYDAVLLQETEAILARHPEVNEEGVYPLTQEYYAALAAKKDTGAAVAKSWAEWREVEAVRKLLRGAELPKVTFVVADRDPGLEAGLVAAIAMPGRWEKRDAVRRLAARVARVSVQVHARAGLEPCHYARPFPANARDGEEWFWLLDADHYSADEGIMIDPEAGDPSESWGAIF